MTHHTAPGGVKAAKKKLLSGGTGRGEPPRVAGRGGVGVDLARKNDPAGAPGRGPRGVNPGAVAPVTTLAQT